MKKQSRQTLWPVFGLLMIALLVLQSWQFTMTTTEIRRNDGEICILDDGSIYKDNRVKEEADLFIRII